MKRYTIHLTDDQERQMLRNIADFYHNEFDEEIGMVKQRAILDFFMQQFAPAIYNQALDDAKGWFGQTMANVEDDYYTLYRESDR